MTEKFLFFIKPFASLNISDFSSFFRKKLHLLPLKKVNPPIFSQQLPLKIEILISPLFLKTW